jgi:hypothetical protein
MSFSSRKRESTFKLDIISEHRICWERGQLVVGVKKLVCDICMKIGKLGTEKLKDLAFLKYETSVTRKKNKCLRKPSNNMQGDTANGEA